MCELSLEEIKQIEQICYEQEEELAEKAEEDIAPINYHNITTDDMLNGDGLRTVLWVAGCSHCCKDCQNPNTWDERSGIPFTKWDEAEFWEKLSKPWIQGATFSGGDPLHCANRKYILSLAEEIKKQYNDNKDIWLYTGYTVNIAENKFIFSDDMIKETFDIPFNIIKNIDIIVDGRFDTIRRKDDIQNEIVSFWRGSSNQRIIDVKASIRENKICERIYFPNGAFVMK